MSSMETKLHHCFSIWRTFIVLNMHLKIRYNTHELQCGPLKWLCCDVAENKDESSEKNLYLTQILLKLKNIPCQIKLIADKCWNPNII